MEGLDYWERLEALGMYSQERRRERYQILFIWKLSQGLIKGYCLPFYHSERRGLLVHTPKFLHKSPSAVKNAREASLQVKGSRLFNLIPSELRDLSGTVEQFKAGLDGWLQQIPDQPTVNGRARAANSNSLLDQVPMHQRNLTVLTS